MSAAHTRKVKRWTDFDPALVECLRLAFSWPTGRSFPFDDKRTARSFQHRMKLMCREIRADDTAEDNLRIAAHRVAFSAPKLFDGRWVVHGRSRTPFNVPLDEVIRQLHANAVSTES